MELKKFASLDPYMCHISDGIYSSDIDNHKHFGEGDFPLKDLLSFLRPGTPITLETPKKDYINLKEDLKNLKKIRIELKSVEKKKL
jgi:endonuclease IV